MTTDQDSISWGELAELTHVTQVERFGWCACEDSGTLVYMDCPTLSPFMSYEMICPDCDCAITQVTRLEPFATCSCGGTFTLITEPKELSND